MVKRARKDTGRSKMKIKIIIAVVLFCTISIGYFYIQALEGQIAAAEEVQQRLEGVIEEQQLVLDRNAEDIKKMQEINKVISDKFNDTQQEVGVLRGKFDKINLAKSASTLPTETEMKINRGTKDALRCNELITGAKLTNDEKSGKVQNNMCSDFLKKAIAKEPKNVK
jgi:hypothetical protein